jgi:hypothetical protein
MQHVAVMRVMHAGNACSMLLACVPSMHDAHDAEEMLACQSSILHMPLTYKLHAASHSRCTYRGLAACMSVMQHVHATDMLHACMSRAQCITALDATCCTHVHDASQPCMQYVACTCMMHHTLACNMQRACS